MSEDTFPRATPGTYRLDPIHSTVGISAMHKISRFRSGVAEFDATLEVDDSGEMTLNGSARAASIQVKNDEQYTHLQSPEFFDALRHPTVQFRSTSVTLADDETLVVIGDLTARGHTERVELRGRLLYVADDSHATERVGIDLETVIDRRRFGVTWNQRLPGGRYALSNEVTLTAEFELPKAKV
ncbi:MULTISPECIES: YceI family protein [Rhodococcus]|uniref:Lipid/polyisoprenoid-binding YceI-like domain-containing protein n=2 Tax=Rhodococcus TaxID=1827 RepID=X0Q8C5_RHOWR|nr:MULTISPECIES: YceI family protein [Rhodococcus]KXX58042.1 hypothetical protein AZG88_46955 [Rhodococcus sp. LB1]WAM19153.1 YceI family protein [Rhodococcus sp. JS3073]GAF47091.1 hypothetical protein RW1_038_00100 [Rhodococcus wratislaviensis NBRC 100605]SEB43928.1 Polyisoprenoid-binding protein YceI [Rhodococcus jostii]